MSNNKISQMGGCGSTDDYVPLQTYDGVGSREPVQTYNNRALTSGNTKKFFKFLRHDFTHYGYKYKLGHNIDNLPFNPTGSCRSGGLYFTNEVNINEYESYGHHLAVIELYPHSKVYYEGTKAKADQFYIEDIIDPKNINCVNVNEPTLEDIKKCPSNIKNHKNPTFEMCREAVSRNGLLIKFIPFEFRTQELKEIAVSRTGAALALL